MIQEFHKKLESYQFIIVYNYFNSVFNNKEYIEGIPELYQSFNQKYGDHFSKLNRLKYKLDPIALKHITFFACLIESYSNSPLLDLTYNNLIVFFNELKSIRKALKKFRNNPAVTDFYRDENDNTLERIDQLLFEFEELGTVNTTQGSTFFQRQITLSFIEYLTSSNIAKSQTIATEISMDLFEIIGMKIELPFESWVRTLQKQKALNKGK